MLATRERIVRTGSAAAATPRARVSGPDVGTPPATARLAMGGGVSNAGISRMLARQGPDPGGGGGGGGSGAGAPAGGEIDWPAFWADDTLNSIRQVGEVTRVIPFVGLATGGASDLINAGQDLFGATWQYEAPIAHTLIGLRSGVNLLNNGYGHVIYVAQMIQDGLLSRRWSPRRRSRSRRGSSRRRRGSRSRSTSAKRCSTS